MAIFRMDSMPLVPKFTSVCLDLQNEFVHDSKLSRKNEELRTAIQANLETNTLVFEAKTSGTSHQREGNSAACTVWHLLHFALFV